MRTKVSGFLVLAGAALWLAAVPVYAHHAFAAEYDATKPVTLDGTITKIELVNPHAWLYVDAKDETGKMVNWAIECGPPNALIRRGWRADSIPVGTKVIIKGFAAKSVPNHANGGDIRLPDGKVLFLGTSGNGSPYDQKDLPK